MEESELDDKIPEVKPGERTKIIDPVTKTEYIKIPVWYFPEAVNTEDKFHVILHNFWYSVLEAYSFYYNKDLAEDCFNFSHPAGIIYEVEEIPGDDIFNKDKIVGWNLVMLGKFDASLMGCIIAFAETHNMVFDQVSEDKDTKITITDHYNFGFGKSKLKKKVVEDREDICSFFLERTQLFGDLYGWCGARIGRVASREKWKKIKIDFKKKETRQSLEGMIKVVKKKTYLKNKQQNNK